jgi:hypothetical protein
MAVFQDKSNETKYFVKKVWIISSESATEALELTEKIAPNQIFVDESRKSTERKRHR